MSDVCKIWKSVGHINSFTAKPKKVETITFQKSYMPVYILWQDFEYKLYYKITEIKEKYENTIYFKLKFKIIFKTHEYIHAAHPVSQV